MKLNLKTGIKVATFLARNSSKNSECLWHHAGNITIYILFTFFSELIKESLD